VSPPAPGEHRQASLIARSVLPAATRRDTSPPTEPALVRLGTALDADPRILPPTAD
jgi:hypothetical protein